jgi:hypothetical protein
VSEEDLSGPPPYVSFGQIAAMTDAWGSLCRYECHGDVRWHPTAVST